jgi:hypothetical protein
MAIGVLIREGRFDTGVASHGKCYSACVLILAAGVHRTVATGKVGVHRPYYDQGLYIPGVPVRAEAQYGQVTDGIQQYFASMGMRDGLTDAMMKVPSKFMRHLTSREVATYGLDNSAPCEIVQVPSLDPAAADEPEVRVLPARKTKAVHYKNRQMKSQSAARRPSRQGPKLTGPWSREASLPRAALKRDRVSLVASASTYKHRPW